MEQPRISEQLEYGWDSTGTIPRVPYGNNGRVVDKTELGIGFIRGCVEYPQLEGILGDQQSCTPMGKDQLL